MIEARFRTVTGLGNIADRCRRITTPREHGRRTVQNEILDILVFSRTCSRQGRPACKNASLRIYIDQSFDLLNKVIT
jgi:hypothetical protein